MCNIGQAIYHALNLETAGYIRYLKNRTHPICCRIKTYPLNTRPTNFPGPTLTAICIAPPWTLTLVQTDLWCHCPQTHYQLPIADPNLLQKLQLIIHTAQTHINNYLNCCAHSNYHTCEEYPYQPPPLPQISDRSLRSLLICDTSTL
jgi:hypothetical protein